MTPLNSPSACLNELSYTELYGTDPVCVHVCVRRSSAIVLPSVQSSSKSCDLSAHPRPRHPRRPLPLPHLHPHPHLRPRPRLH